MLLLLLLSDLVVAVVACSINHCSYCSCWNFVAAAGMIIAIATNHYNQSSCL